MRMITLASSGVDEPPQPWQVPPVTCHGFSLLIASHGLVAALTRAAFFGLEGPSSLLLFTTPGSCRRPHQGGFFWSGGSLLIAALYHPRVLSPPSPGRLFLVWRVPPHCCSLPPQGLVAALTRAAFFWLSRLACRSQRCPLTSQGFRRLVGDRLRRANGAAGAQAALLELPNTAQESFGLPSPGRAQLLQRMLDLGRNPRRSA